MPSFTLSLCCRYRNGKKMKTSRSRRRRQFFSALHLSPSGLFNHGKNVKWNDLYVYVILARALVHFTFFSPFVKFCDNNHSIWSIYFDWIQWFYHFSRSTMACIEDGDDDCQLWMEWIKIWREINRLDSIHVVSWLKLNIQRDSGDWVCTHSTHSLTRWWIESLMSRKFIFITKEVKCKCKNTKTKKAADRERRIRKQKKNWRERETSRNYLTIHSISICSYPIHPSARTRTYHVVIVWSDMACCCIHDMYCTYTERERCMDMKWKDIFNFAITCKTSIVAHCIQASHTHTQNTKNKRHNK